MGGADDTTPGCVIARARQLSVAEALDRFARPSEWAVEHWEDVIEHHVHVTKADLGEAPGPELWAAVARGNEIELERCLLRWEEQRRRTLRREQHESFGWFDPRGHE